MAITNVLAGVLNDSLTNQMLVQNLIADSTFLSNTAGIVDGTLTQGKIVKNSLMTQPTAVAYTGDDFTPADIDDTAKPVTVNQADQWSAKILDVDVDQTYFTAESLQSEIARLGSSALSTSVDSYSLGAVAAGAGQTGTTVVTITSANVEAYVAEQIKLLMAKNVRQNDIQGFVPYYVYAAIQQAGGVVTESAQAAFSAGRVMDFMGAKIILNNNLDFTTSLETAAKTVWSTPWASQYVIGGSNIESDRVLGNFATVVKGYTLYGAGVLNADAVVSTVVGG